STADIEVIQIYDSASNESQRLQEIQNACRSRNMSHDSCHSLRNFQSKIESTVKNSGDKRPLILVINTHGNFEGHFKDDDYENTPITASLFIQGHRPAFRPVWHGIRNLLSGTARTVIILTAQCFGNKFAEAATDAWKGKPENIKILFLTDG